VGKKVLKQIFQQYEFDEFARRVKQETELLQQWTHAGLLNDNVLQSGFELEFWLLNHDLSLANNNLDFIKGLNQNFLITEADQSCLEINLPCDSMHDRAFLRHQKSIAEQLELCDLYAAKQNQHIIAIGTLPTAIQADFSEMHLTNENRYHAINHRLAVLRDHQPKSLHISGVNSLNLLVETFALVGAICSFQIHFRVPMEQTVRLYNAATALSAPMIALSANAPVLFGHTLWEESRIPFYEQILLTGNPQELLPRVTFGSRYLKHSFMELFIENASHYLPLLPQVMEDSPEKFEHLKLHNGNIYRWNRPIFDFDQNGQPHFRLEHRPLSAGPTVIDMIANAAFYFGITYYYLNTIIPIEEQLPFVCAKNNFYAAAQYGLDAEIMWCNNEKIILKELIVTRLLSVAKEGLKQLDINSIDIEFYLSIIEARVRKNSTGSRWQREFLNKNNHDHTLLVQTYLDLQRIGKPVHEWPTV